MKKIISFCIALFFISCTSKKLEYDMQGIVLHDTVSILPHDRYYQEQVKPTRGGYLLLDIRNNSDTARTFLINITESK